MGEPASLSSRISVGVANVPGVDVLEELVNNGMVTVDNHGNWLARLAEAVPSVENSLWRVFPDGRMETTWRIRENARWHDGVPFTSDDLIFALKVGQDKDLPNFGDVAFASVEGAQAPDPRTLTVNWKQPFIGADTMFSHRVAMPLPRHLLERAYEEDKAGFTQLPYWSLEFIGTGPYRVREWAKGSHIMLEANESYALGRPRISEVQIRFIADQNTLIANVLAGAVELVVGRNLSLDQAMQVRQQWADGKVDVGFRGISIIWPQFLNPNPPAVAKLEFRRALVHGMDRQQLVDTLMGGLVPVADSFINPKRRRLP
jgi:peptide/nickel transport system substrate-binding protein